MSSNTLNAEQKAEQKAEIASRLIIERFTSPNINTENPEDINRRIRDLTSDYKIEHIKYIVDGMEETELPNKEAIQKGIEEFKKARGNATLGGRRKTRRNRKGKKACKTHKGKKSQKGGKKSKKHGKKHGKKHAKKTRRHSRK